LLQVRVLEAGSRIWEIAGHSTTSSPFLINGNFDAQTSTFKYTTDQDTNITATTYYNLELIDPPSQNSKLQLKTQNLKENTQQSEDDNSIIEKLGSFFYSILKKASLSFKKITDYFSEIFTKTDLIFKLAITGLFLLKLKLYKK